MGNVADAGVSGGGYSEEEYVSQTFKSSYGDWSVRKDAYDSEGMQKVKENFDNILSSMKEANEDINNSGIEFMTLGKIELTYTNDDVRAMDEMRENLVSFTTDVHENVLDLIDRPFHSALCNLGAQISEHMELKINYLGTDFDLEYNFANPQHLSDWMFKAVNGDEDDFLYTGDEEKDALIKEFTTKDKNSGRYVYEDKMADWNSLSSEEQDVIEHLMVHYSRQYEAYYDDSSSYAINYMDHLNRMLTACTTVEGVAPDSSNPDTYNPDDPGKRFLTYSDAGKALKSRIASNSYCGKLISGLENIDYELYALANECNPGGNKDFQFIYGDLNSGVTFKVNVSHDRAATSMSLSFSCDRGKDETETKYHKEYYETYKDSFDAINERVSSEPFAYFTDYRRCLRYMNRNQEIEPTMYTHQEELGMSKATLANLLCGAKNTHDMECLDKMVSSYGDYTAAFSVDATKLSDEAKAQVKRYVGTIKDIAYNYDNEKCEPCLEELYYLCCYFQQGDAKSVTGYWPLCSDSLEDFSTKIFYYSYENSEDYDPEFAGLLRTAENMMDGTNSIPSSAREAWLADEKHQEAYLVMLKIKNPDMFNPYWQDMSEEQRKEFGRISASLSQEYSYGMLALVDEQHRTEAFYYYGESSGFNARASAINRKISEHDNYIVTNMVNDDGTLDPLEDILSEEELQIVNEYVARYSHLDIMTQEQYKVLSNLSSRIEADYEAAHPWEAFVSIFDSDYIDYMAFRRRGEDDIRYLVAKEANNTAYVHDESTTGKVLHTIDSVYHGATSIKKNFDDIGYAIEKKLDIGDETYQEYIDYKHSLETQEYEQAMQFSEGGYILGKIGTDLVLMWAGGELLEAVGATGAATEGLVSLGLSREAATVLTEIGMEQVMPTVLYIIPNGVNNYLHTYPLSAPCDVGYPRSDSQVTVLQIRHP